LESKDILITQYVKNVKEKELLLERFSKGQLSEEEIHTLLLLDCKLNDLVGKMLAVGLLEVEISED
jgi:hypothetical protein